MVINYKGVAQEKPKKAPPQAVRVEDYMTRDLITFHQDQTIEEVIDTLLKNRISGGPVIDNEGHLVGVISEGDCLKEVVKGKYTNTPNLSSYVRDRMVSEVRTVTPEMNIFDLAQMFLDVRLRRFPVLRNGKLIGQISQKDVMKAVLKLNNTTW